MQKQVIIALALLALPAANLTAAQPQKRIVFHDPGFTLFQDGPRMMDLAAPGQNYTELCEDVALAHIANYQRRYRKPAFPDLKAAPQDYDGNGRVDAYDLIRYFRNACHTSLARGTNTAAGARCLRGYYNTSGYTDAKVLMIQYQISASDRNLMDLPGIRAIQRKVQWSDLTAGIDRDMGVMIAVQWMVKDATTGKWKVDGGHALAIYGYAETAAAPGQPPKLELYIMDPDENYRGKTGYTIKEMRFVDWSSEPPTGARPAIKGGVMAYTSAKTGETYYGMLAATIVGTPQ